MSVYFIRYNFTTNNFFHFITFLVLIFGTGMKCRVLEGNVALSTPWKCTGGEKVALHSFLNWTLDGDEWSGNFMSRSLYSGEETLAFFK